MKKTVHNYSEFGKKIKISMVNLNINNKELARELGYKESTLCDILKGRNRCEWRMIEILETISRLERGESKEEQTPDSQQ